MNTSALAGPTNNLHHPRPTMAGRSAASNNTTSNVQRPNIQYPVTLVPRPSAPAPASPGIVSGGGSSYFNSSNSTLPKRTGSTSPSVNRRKKWSSDSSTPTYADEHVIQHFDTPDYSPDAIQPAVLRQRSASSPDHMKSSTMSPISIPRSESPQASAPGIVGRAAAPRPANGNVHFTPDNLFVSFTQSNTLIIHNLTPSNNGPNPIMESVRGDVMTLWPTGIRLDDERRGQWTIRFAGDIWKARQRAAIISHRLVAKLFSVLAVHGYAYLCCLHEAQSMGTPRHLFTSAPPSVTKFFTLSFSVNKHKLTFVDAPSDIIVAVSNSLRNATLFDVEEIDTEMPDAPEVVTPLDIGGDETEEEVPRVHSYKLKKHAGVSRAKDDVQLFLTRDEKADLLLLFSQMLKIIASFGYILDASIPLGKVGFLGLKGRRELWIFKATSPQKGSKSARTNQKL
ncbi:hypothetical protein CPB86DRAFT_710824 [Serendipita vermifera]|nr:hypothetical protein CPB86DRAFT_710824 [Serendipita vermifera]